MLGASRVRRSIWCFSFRGSAYSSSFATFSQSLGKRHSVWKPFPLSDGALTWQSEALDRPRPTQLSGCSAANTCRLQQSFKADDQVGREVQEGLIMQLEQLERGADSFRTEAAGGDTESAGCARLESGRAKSLNFG